jgi:hypothetical protein
VGKPSVRRSKTRGRIRLLCGLAVFSFTGLQFWPGGKHIRERAYSARARARTATEAGAASS